MIKFCLTNDSATMPRKAHETDAGFDVFSIEEVTLHSMQRTLVKTGVRVQLPVGYHAKICSRSGLALNHGVVVLNAPGIIDNEYRGDIGVILINLGNETVTIKADSKIAQMIVERDYSHHVVEVDALSDTVRGVGGFGSTGE
jgi:dUTP pyrophosphatase